MREDKGREGNHGRGFGHLTKGWEGLRCPGNLRRNLAYAEDFKSLKFREYRRRFGAPRHSAPAKPPVLPSLSHIHPVRGFTPYKVYKVNPVRGRTRRGEHPGLQA